MKSVPFALALLAGALVAPAYADDQLTALNNQVYLGVAAEPTTYTSVQTLLPEDAVYQALNNNIQGDGKNIRNAHAGFRWQRGSTGMFLEGQARRSSGTVTATRTISGATNPPPPLQRAVDWNREEVLGNFGWAFSLDGGAMQMTPFVTVGSMNQSALTNAGLNGSTEQVLKSSFVGLGFKHQTSLTPAVALEVEAAYERHNLDWRQVSLDVFGQPTSANGSIAVKRADGARLGLGLSQQVWKNVRVNYGLRYNRLSVTGVFADTDVSLSQGVTSVSLGLGVTF